MYSQYMYSQYIHIYFMSDRVFSCRPAAAAAPSQFLSRLLWQQRGSVIDDDFENYFLEVLWFVFLLTLLLYPPMCTHTLTHIYMIYFSPHSRCCVILWRYNSQVSSGIQLFDSPSATSFLRDKPKTSFVDVHVSEFEFDVSYKPAAREALWSSSKTNSIWRKQDYYILNSVFFNNSNFSP